MYVSYHLRKERYMENLGCEDLKSRISIQKIFQKIDTAYIRGQMPSSEQL